MNGDEIRDLGKCQINEAEAEDRVMNIEKL